MKKQASSIPMLRPKLPMLNEYDHYIKQIDESRVYTNYGPLSRAFAQELSLKIGARTNAPNLQVALTSSGTTAIEVALRGRVEATSGLCLMPSYTFVASAHAVVNAGFRPVFLDVNSESYALDPDTVRRSLSSFTEHVAAVLVVSAFGAPVDIASWEQFEYETGVPVIFDAAAAIASLDYIGNQPVCVSMHATKVLGIGEGGAVFSRNSDLIDRLAAITGFGFYGAERRSDILGGNYRISEYNAAVGLAALRGLEQKIARLKNRIEYYKSVSENPHIFQKDVGDRWVTMTLNIAPCSTIAKSIVAALDERAVPWRHWWGLGCHTHPAFERFSRHGTLENTTNLARRVIGLPFFEDIEDWQIEEVADAIRPLLV